MANFYSFARQSYIGCLLCAKMVWLLGCNDKNHNSCSPAGMTDMARIKITASVQRGRTLTGDLGF